MAKEYYSQADAVMRLDNTVCLYDGVPYFVLVDPGNAPDGVVLVDLHKVTNFVGMAGPEKYQKVKYTDPKFEYKSPTLGYMQWRRHAVYVKRIPDRKQRQGLAPELIKGSVNEAENVNPNSFNMLYSDNFREMIQGKYRTQHEAVEMILGGNFHSVPISRTLAFRKLGGKTMALDFKTKFVGTKEADESHFKLFSLPEAGFLSKILARHGVYTK